MYAVQPESLPAWRQAARGLLHAGISPQQVVWGGASAALFPPPPPAPAPPLRVPRAFADIATPVACHRDDRKWALLYQLLWRLTHGEAGLCRDAADPLVRQLTVMAKQVGHDIHRAHAFVRFRRVLVDGDDTYLAYHRPDHLILPLTVGFFVERFRNQRWGILTPDASVCWDGQNLHWGAGMPAAAAPPADALETLWGVFYRAVFNPARVKVACMTRAMPSRYWATMPETAHIPAMLAEAPARVAAMLAATLADDPKGRRILARQQRRQGCTPADATAMPQRSIPPPLLLATRRNG